MTDEYFVDEDASVIEVAQALLGIIEADRPKFERIQDYIDGRHDGPYVPNNATAEYRLLAERCISNWMPLVLNTVAQAIYVDGYRPGRTDDDEDTFTEARSTLSPQWDFFQRSRFGSRQVQIHRGALGFGVLWVVVEKDETGKAIGRVLHGRETAGIFADPVNDEKPLYTLTVWRKQADNKPGLASMWDDVNRYDLALSDKITVLSSGPHGATENPCTRFSPAVDFLGRSTGLVEPLIPLNDRINQSVFDLLVAQTYGAFKVRYVTGMAPPIRRDADGNPILDENGNAVPLPINHNASRFLFAEDPDTNYGSLDETPLSGYIESIDMSVRHLSAMAQVPPHHLLGQIANLSAEALSAAETSLSRKIEEFRHTFGESWERVFRIAMQIEGEDGAEDYHGDVIWRDMEARSLSMTADALGKLKDQLGIPAQGLWPRVPGVTQSELDEWADLIEKADPNLVLAGAINSAASMGGSGSQGQSADITASTRQEVEIK